jgi:hypothetical protein
MKQYTHAWLAMMAMKRLEKTNLSAKNRKAANLLVKWFKNNRDFVVQGAWYPDAVIKDMATSHILKHEPLNDGKKCSFRKLPGAFHLYEIGKKSALYQKSFVNVKGNLPDRCESLAHAIIDNLKMQESEEKGSPISPTDNHVATIFFMLSHYIADAHMPLHCDSRAFSDGDDIHAHIEKEWDEMVRDCYKIDFDNERFFYNEEGYPVKKDVHSVADWLEKELVERKFSLTWGSGNRNTWDYMSAITQYSYLAAYEMIPAEYTEENLSWEDFEKLDRSYTFDDYSKFLLMDSIDSIAKIWLRVWMKYLKWMKGKE